MSQRLRNSRLRDLAEHLENQRLAMERLKADQGTSKDQRSAKKGEE